MFEKLNQLNVTDAEMATIEVALNTQVKILNLQVAAGGGEALARLNEVKKTLAKLTPQMPCDVAESKHAKSSWFGMTCLFC